MPQQPNSSDCGLFMLRFTKEFMTARTAPFHCGNLDQRKWFDPMEVSESKVAQPRCLVLFSVLDCHISD